MGKTLFVGHFLESTSSGWRSASIEYVRSLLSVGEDVVCRSIVINERNNDLPPDIQACLAKPAEGCQYVVNCVLPHYLEYSGLFQRNIALPFLDSKNLIWSGWISKLRIVDKVIVSNRQMRDHLVYDEKLNCEVVPVPCDINRFNNLTHSVEIPGRDGDYLFCYVGDINKRKNLRTLLEAFYSEFSFSEPVNLLIKTSPSCRSNIEQLAQVVQQALRLRRYKQPLILAQNLKEENLFQVINSCDCYVSTAFSESWGLPIFQSYALGKSVIAPASGGPRDYLPDSGLVGVTEVMCTGADTFSFLQTAREKWWSPNLDNLRNRMRSAYRGELKPSKPDLDNYSYEVVGKQLLKEIKE